MKFFLYLSLAAMMLGACGTKKKTAKTVIENYFKVTANDPASYETINVTLMDSIMVTDQLKEDVYFKKQYLHSDSTELQVDKESIEFEKKNSLPIDDDNRRLKEHYTKYKEDSTELASLNYKLDSIAKSGHNKVHLYSYLNESRGKNSFGALVLQKTYVYLNDTLGIVSTADANDNGHQIHKFNESRMR